MDPLERIHARLAPLRKALLEHRVYSRIDRLESLHIFMQHHVFAVWDFMSLLKTLQRRLSCTQVPWLPPANRQGCRLVNEIVLAEESDEDGKGSYASHFDLYFQAMQRCGADTEVMDLFLKELQKGSSIQHAVAQAGARMPCEILSCKPSKSSMPTICALSLRPSRLVAKIYCRISFDRS